MRNRILVTFSLFALLAVTLAFAQTRTIKADVTFPFVASGKTLPAGSYEFIPQAQPDMIRVVGPKGNVAMVPVLTRLSGAIHTTKQDAHIVFDKVGEVYTLSEIWAPDQDGWVLATTSGKHEHKVLDVPR